MANQSDIPSIKDLASSDPALRRHALTTILADLSDRTNLTPIQALQLWKGFFYALYMHDSKSPLSVQALIAQLAALVHTTPPATSLALTLAFWTTICREWSNIDAHRMDKYLLLVRMVVREVFGVVLGENGEGGQGQAKEQVELLAGFPLSPRERKVPDGLRYHVLDIYVDEVEKVWQDGETKMSKEVRGRMDRLLVPVEILAKDGLTKSVRIRAKEVLADERILGWKGLSNTIPGEAAGTTGTAEEEWEGLG